MLYAIEESFNYVSEFVFYSVVPLVTGAFAYGDNRLRAATTNLLSQGIAVVALVADDVFGRKVLQQCFGFHHIVTFAAGQ